MQGSVHYFTLKQNGYNESNTAVTFYHDKTHFASQNENPYAKYTESFNAAQGRTFILHNKKATIPSKMTMIKDKVKEFDELLLSRIPSNTNASSSALNDNLQSPVIKTIWITSSLILLVLQDAHLVWIHVDSISCELLQILVDKSLIQVNPPKLSGTIVCDVLMYLNQLNKKSQTDEFAPKLILAYLDKSRIDIIGFAKPANFISYLNSTEIKLEKLQSFEPNISFMDFSCPTSYRIEKHLCYSSLETNGFQSNTTMIQSFALWWPNDGQIVWTPSVALSSLEKSDFSTNVIVVNHSGNNKDSLVQYQFKSTGILLQLLYLNDATLIAVEQSESTTQQFIINIYKYELTNEIVRPRLHSAQHSLKNVIFTFNLNSKIKYISNLSNTKRYLVMISNDLTVYLCDLIRKIAHKYRLNTDQFNTSNLKAEWILSDLIFCIYDINSKINFYDIAFNQIDLSYLSRDRTAINTLNENLNANVFDLNNNFFSHLVSFNNTFLDTVNISFIFQKGPFGILHLILPNTFNELALVSLYLKSDASDQTKLSQNIIKAVNLLNKLDWEVNGDVCILCFNKILNYLLSEEVGFNLQIQMFIEQTLASFYTPQRPLSEKTIEDYKYLVTRYARKFFYQLLRYENFDKAYLLAIDIGAKDLFNDLYYCAIDRRELQLAELCRKKFKEMAMEELQLYFKTQSKSSTSLNQIQTSDTELGISEDYESSEEPYSDEDSYSSSINDDIQVSHLSIHRQIDRIYNDKEIKSVNQELMKRNEALISATKNNTISFSNFTF